MRRYEANVYVQSRCACAVSGRFGTHISASVSPEIQLFTIHANIHHEGQGAPVLYATLAFVAPHAFLFRSCGLPICNRRNGHPVAHRSSVFDLACCGRHIRLLKTSAPAAGEEQPGGQARLEAVEEEETVRMHLASLKREEVALQVSGFFQHAMSLLSCRLKCQFNVYLALLDAFAHPYSLNFSFCL